MVDASRTTAERSPRARLNERKASVTADEVLGWPASVNLWPEAGRAVGLSRGVTYELVKRGEFPVPTLRLGNRWMVLRADLITFLGIGDR